MGVHLIFKSNIRLTSHVLISVNGDKGSVIVSLTDHQLLCVCVCVCVSELQASVDGLLADKLQLEQEREDLIKQQHQLREQVRVCVCVCV